MAEYIEREALLANLKRQYGEDLGWQGTINMSDVGMMIEDAPAADVVEATHGEWVWKSNGYIKRLFCSCCNGEEDWPSTFCPKCGAKMDGERSNEDAE